MSTLKAIVQAARAWRDPSHRPRHQAVQATLNATNRFTEQALAFAINQQMREINVAALKRWLDGRSASTARTVGVLEAGNVPLAGLQDYLAVVLTGHCFVGAVSSRSPALLEAFADDVTSRDGPSARFVGHDVVVGEVEALIASGTDHTIGQLASMCREAGIAQENRLLRGNRFAVAVLDGQEHQEQRLRLAEDALLHEGLGCRNVALIFAPEALDADPYLEALSVFRGTFPAHADTEGALKMQQAFLAAVQAPHAYGDGLVYLVSRGEAEVQGPGHVRWVPYTDLEAVNRWLTDHRDELQLVVARPRVQEKLRAEVPMVAPGLAQRPPLDWKPDRRDTIEFLARLQG